MNPDAAYDCGKPTGPIWKVAWAGVEDKWPGAAEIIRNYTLTNEEMGAMVSAIDLDGQSIEAVADQWMADNADKVDGWIN